MADLDLMLRFAVERGASDLHLSTGVTPMIRVDGQMTTASDTFPPLSAEHFELMVGGIMPERNAREFQGTSDTDFAYEIADVGRFRVNVFRGYRGSGAVMRHIPGKILSLEDLSLPPVVKGFCGLHKGLVLVTGPTGSGKSTTLAAMIDHINARRRGHIITIEDPIEFVHPNRGCLVTQREVHGHTDSFSRALRAALREDPDVVLLGEMRDLETMETAIATAETGHLVFGTVHTTSAANTVDRVINQFPADRQNQIRAMLSVALKGVVAQTLLRRKDGGRVAALELLVVTPAVANFIREGKTYQIPSAIQTGKKYGMTLMNDDVLRLVREGIVDPVEAYQQAADKQDMAGKLKLAGFGLRR